MGGGGAGAGAGFVCGSFGFGRLGALAVYLCMLCLSVSIDMDTMYAMYVCMYIRSGEEI